MGCSRMQHKHKQGPEHVYHKKIQHQRSGKNYQRGGNEPQKEPFIVNPATIGTKYGICSYRVVAKLAVF